MSAKCKDKCYKCGTFFQNGGRFWRLKTFTPNQCLSTSSRKSEVKCVCEAVLSCETRLQPQKQNIIKSFLSCCLPGDASEAKWKIPEQGVEEEVRHTV